LGSERAQRVTISTHVLDTSIGRPAAGISVLLQQQSGATWTDILMAITDPDGRVPALVPPSAIAGAGGYRLTFDVGDYFRQRGIESFYERVSIEFLVRDTAAHYHVPLLLNPYGYSTYRGS
jgi:5-hydroxyisourate hydrolase